MEASRGRVWQQHTTYCNLLQHTATYCNNTLPHTATHCNSTTAASQGRQESHCRAVSQHAATHCNTPQQQHTATHCNTLQHTATALRLRVRGGSGIVVGRCRLDGTVSSSMLPPRLRAHVHARACEHSPRNCHAPQQHTAPLCNTLQHKCEPSHTDSPGSCS